MYIYIYAYIYVCVWVYMYMYIYIYTHIYIPMYIHTYIYTFTISLTRIHLHTYIQTNTQIHKLKHICILVSCVFASTASIFYVLIIACVHIYTLFTIYKYYLSVPTSICVCAGYVCMYAHVHTYICIHTLHLWWRHGEARTRAHARCLPAFG